ncbi:MULTISPECIES: AIPR family protein [Streptomyces]|uniref:AIPR family protein n=1 Tax=Streptomyces TaxID=1883 RepID=UPI0025B46017|nr:AIPR family protein [Streptomyces sp. P9-2B-1]WJY32278.1 AIPR family protein [Streptomyces sp. P9-2B-1]
MSQSFYIRNLSRRLIERFEPFIDVTDEPGISEKKRKEKLLSRAVAALAVKRETGYADREAALSVIDGRDDWGIDAIAVELSASGQGGRPHITLVQAKWSENATAGFGQSEVDRLFRGLDYLMNLEFSRFNKRIEQHTEALEKALDSGSPKITLLLALVTDTELHPDTKALLDSEVKKRNWAEEMVEWRVIDLRGLYQEILGEHADRKIDLEAWVEGVGREEIPFTAYYGTLSAAEVAEWYETHDRHLFARNIRDSLDTDVNDKIRATLLHEPQNFWYFSNGITLLCDRIRKKGKGAFSPGAGAGFVLEGASVVNGAQTVSAMYRAMQRNSAAAQHGRVMVKIISLENCPEGFGDQVTLNTNTQNPIEERDWKSRDPIQTGLRDDFALSLGRTYVVKRGESEPAPDSGCTMTDAAEALAATHRNPELAAKAKRDISLLWEKANYQEIFGRTLNTAPSAQQVWRRVQLVRAVKAALAEQSDDLFGRAASAASNGDLLISHVVFQNLDTDGLDDEHADWDAQLARVPELVERTLGWLVTTIDRAYGPTSQMLTSMRTAERVRLVSRRVLESMRSGEAAPDNADYRVEERPQGKPARSTNATSLIVKAERITPGTGLEFRPVTRPDRLGLGAWLAENPDRARATWQQNTTRPLRWAADGQSYAPSTLVRKIRKEAMGNNQQVQGTLYWHIPGEGSLVDLAAELRAEDELTAGDS